MYLAKVSGLPIDIGNISITLRLKNPMFDPNNGMEWSASYPFTLPNTLNNRAIFGFPGRLSSNADIRKDFVFEHSFNGIILPGDTISVKQTTKDTIEAYIKIGRSDFISTNKDKLLTSLAFDTQVFQVTDPEHPDYLFSIFDQSYPDINFAIFPVRNNGFYSDPDFEAFWNGPTNYSGPYQNMVYFDDNGLLNSNPNELTPFPYVAAVIDKIFSETQYKLKRSFFHEDTELINTCIFNPNRCTYVRHFTEDSIVNIQIQKHLPRMKVTDFFIALRVPFGLDLYFNYFKKEVSLLTRKEIITGTDIVDFSSRISSDYKVYVEPIVTDYLFSMKGDSNDAYWQENVKNMDEYLVSSGYIEVDNWSDLVGLLRGAVGYVRNEDKYYILEKNDYGTLEWQFLSLNLLDYKVNTGETFKVEGDIGCLISEYHRYAGSPGAYAPWSWYTPVTSIPGNFENAANGMQDYSEFALRLMFRRGIAEEPNGFTYPYGTSFYSNIHLDPDWEKYIMRWVGPGVPSEQSNKGLIKTCWQEWIDWRIKSKQIEFTKQMDPLEIHNMDFTKKYRAYDINLIIEEINITITPHALKPATIKAWTV